MTPELRARRNRWHVEQRRCPRWLPVRKCKVLYWWWNDELLQRQRSAMLRVARQPNGGGPDLCNRNGCAGIINERPVENCRCHICPPCHACTESRVFCPECGWEPSDDELKGDQT